MISVEGTSHIVRLAVQCQRVKAGTGWGEIHLILLPLDIHLIPGEVDFKY